MEHRGELLQAIAFAAARHRDQRRKDAEASPYINHPIAVATALWHEGGVRDQLPLLAAILHDTIEDTATTAAELTAAFGAEVAAVVVEVTDDKSLPKARRKELQIEHAPHLSRAARLVKLADKLCNLRDIIASPPAAWSAERRAEYVGWTAEVVAGLRGVCPPLEDEFDAAQARWAALGGA
ncbi:MAG: bifunctional (p)ppGpp synthetase/guanosine-3',5'-bis(diphosphate) 3'-pyrophosphohydrolase [Myxococcales bacterium]|nr:bifunctional (p)ppGpp synthetase/guanosine-3',5'-bis(diphosphate) 3'-pyrophosphohydrolase [Myxococcales bacterium]